MKKIVKIILRFFAQKIIAKYNPKIVAITGSVGKTSTKEAVFAVLNTKFKVRKNIKNYNNELGVPLTIIGCESAGKSFFGWLNIFSHALYLLNNTDKDYPEILVLEFGIDRPGDMSYLCSIAKPDIGILTNISQSHLEFFKDIDELKKEKGELIKSLNKDGWGIINFDNSITKLLVPKDRTAKVLTYGFDGGADVLGLESQISYSNNGLPKGMSFKLKFKGSAVPIFTDGVIGEPVMFAALAASCVGFIYDYNAIEISEALHNVSWQDGRMSLKTGVNNSLIIYDAYNASPESSLAALNIFGKIKKKDEAKTWAIFGDMLELGSYSEKGHKLVGEKIAELKIDNLIIVGDKSRDIAREAHKNGLKKENIFVFADSQQVGGFLKDKINANDLILVKGSRGMRMELTIERILK